MMPAPTGEKVILDGLSKVEQELCRTLHRFEIHGKRGNTVPVLLTAEMKDAVEHLVNGREQVGLHKDNTYLFPRCNYNSLGHIRGCDCLRELSQR